MQGAARAIGTVAEPRADSVGGDPAPRDAPRRVRGPGNRASTRSRRRVVLDPGDPLVVDRGHLAALHLLHLLVGVADRRGAGHLLAVADVIVREEVRMRL